MSFSWSTLLSSAESALSTIAVDAGPIVQAGSALAPVIDLIPGTAPVVTAIEAGAAAITAIAPAAVQDATNAIAAGQKIVSDASPIITEFESIFDTLFHITPTPTGAVLTAKTSAPTAPAAAIAAAPGNALS